MFKVNVHPQIDAYAVSEQLIGENIKYNENKKRYVVKTPHRSLVEVSYIHLYLNKVVFAIDKLSSFYVESIFTKERIKYTKTEQRHYIGVHYEFTIKFNEPQQVVNFVKNFKSHVSEIEQKFQIQRQQFANELRNYAAELRKKRKDV